MTGPAVLAARYGAVQGAGLGMLLCSLGEPPTKVPAGGRIIAGPVVPWDTPGRPTGYPGTVRFLRGSLDLETLAGAPLLLDHDPTRPIGRATGIIDRPTDLAAAYRIAPTPAGDEALTLVAHGIRDGFSIGAVVDGYDLGDPDPETGIPELIVTASHIRETSLLTFPAYATARAGLLPGPERTNDHE
jgi:hypothetical protein